MYKRLFTFGCSWTDFAWPTWADIIARDLDIYYENWGVSGIGNQGIQSRFVECNNKNNFTDTDLVIVQWSGWNREDRFLEAWKASGSIFNNPYYDNKFIKKYWNYNNDLIKNSVAIKTTNDAYLENIGYQWSLQSPATYSDNKENTTRLTPDVVDAYYNHLPKIDTPEFNNTYFNGRCMDSHPDVMAHIEIIEKYIYPNLFKREQIQDKTRQFFSSYSNDMEKILSPRDGWHSMVKKTNKINKKYKLAIGAFSDHYGV